MAKPHPREQPGTAHGYEGQPFDASLARSKTTEPCRRFIKHLTFGSSLLCALIAVPSTTHAQEEEAAEPMPVPTVSGKEPTVPETTMPAVEPGVTKGRKLPDPEPETKAETPVLKIGVGLRTGLAMILNGSGSDQIELALNDGLVDQANMRPYMTAQMTEGLSFFASFELGTRKTLGFDILDAILQVKVKKELQIWIGQHIGANDRNNMNGPFFGNGWNFAIGVPSYPFDVGARDRGITVWGLIAEGRVKYHASVLDLQPGQTLENARYGGRVTVHLLEPEDFYYNSGTYFGKKDVLALGAVVNYQKGVDVVGMPALENDFMGYSFDAFFEKNLGNPGTITLEAGYWNFSNVDPGYVANQGTRDIGTGVTTPYPVTSFFAAASWLAPNKTGIGHLQPNVRWQTANYEGPPTEHVIDVGMGYIIDGFNNRWHLNYRRVNGAVDQDIVQVGAQFMM